MDWLNRDPEWMSPNQLILALQECRAERDRLRAENEALREHHKISVDQWTLEAQRVKELEDNVHELRAENEALLQLARDALKAWDADKDSRVGKLLVAMTNRAYRSTYRPDLFSGEIENHE